MQQPAQHTQPKYLQITHSTQHSTAHTAHSTAQHTQHTAQHSTQHSTQHTAQHSTHSTQHSTAHTAHSTAQHTAQHTAHSTAQHSTAQQTQTQHIPAHPIPSQHSTAQHSAQHGITYICGIELVIWVDAVPEPDRLVDVEYKRREHVDRLVGAHRRDHCKGGGAEEEGGTCE